MNIDNIGPIFIGGFAVEVEDASASLRDRGLMGFMSALDMKIQVRFDDTSDQVQAQTLLHEIIHVIDTVYLEGNALSEAQVMSMSQGLYQFIVDNQDAVEAIQAVSYDDEDVKGETVCSCRQGSCLCSHFVCSRCGLWPEDCTCKSKSDDTPAKS